MKTLVIALLILSVFNSAFGSWRIKFSCKPLGIRNCSVKPVHVASEAVKFLPVIVLGPAALPIVLTKNPISKACNDLSKCVDYHDVDGATSRDKLHEIEAWARNAPDKEIDEDKLLTVDAQNDGWSCGLNCAARLYNYYDVPRSDPYKFLMDNANYGKFPAKKDKVGPATQIVTQVMNKYGRGWEFTYVSGGYLELIYELTRSGHPVIVMVSTSNHDGHYFIVTGVDYSTRQVRYLDTDGIIYEESFGDFDKEWNLEHWSGFIRNAANAQKRSIIFRRTYGDGSTPARNAVRSFTGGTTGNAPSYCGGNQSNYSYSDDNSRYYDSAVRKAEIERKANEWKTKQYNAGTNDNYIDNWNKSFNSAGCDSDGYRECQYKVNPYHKCNQYCDYDNISNDQTECLIPTRKDQNTITSTNDNIVNPGTFFVNKAECQYKWNDTQNPFWT